MLATPPVVATYKFLGELAQKIVEMGLSVRQVEEWGRVGKDAGKSAPPAARSRSDKDADTIALKIRRAKTDPDPLPQIQRWLDEAGTAPAGDGK